MAGIRVTVRPGYTLQDNEAVTPSKLRRMGTPSVSGEIDDETVTPRMTDLGGTFIPAGLARRLREGGAVPVGDLVVGCGAVIDPHAYGAIGDDSHHPMQELVDDGTYADLTEVQEDFPWVESLEDERDWAAIQKALDVAWQQSVATYSLTYGGTPGTARAHCPTVQLRAGFYRINRTLVLPPKVRFCGAGMKFTHLQYTGSGDTKWTIFKPYDATVWDFPRDNSGLYVVLMLRTCVSVATAHITQRTDGTALAHNEADALDDGYSNSGRIVISYPARISGMQLVAEPEGATLLDIAGSNSDSLTIEEVYFSGYQATGAGGYIYGVTLAHGWSTGGGEWLRNLAIRHCVFEGVRYCWLFNTANAVEFVGNRLWGVMAIGQGSMSDSIIAGNHGNKADWMQVRVGGSGFTVPAVGSSVSLTTSYVTAITGPTYRTVYVEGAGYFEVTAKGTGTLSLKNLGWTENAVSGTVIPAGRLVTWITTCGLKILGAGNRIHGNLFAHFREGLLHFGPCSVIGNRFIAPDWALSNDGWAVRICNWGGYWNGTWYTATAPTALQGYGQENRGIVVEGNELQYASLSAPTGRPICFETLSTSYYQGLALTADTKHILYGRAGGNSYAGSSNPADVYALKHPTTGVWAACGIEIAEQNEAHKAITVEAGEIEYGLSTSENDWELRGCLTIVFDNTADHKTVTLPDPASYPYRRLRLNIFKPSTAPTSCAILLGCAVANALQDNKAHDVATSVTLVTSGTAQTMVVVDLRSTGVRWEVCYQ